MTKSFNNYVCFHAWIKGADGIHLFNDNEDKQTYLNIMIDVCKSYAVLLNVFQILNTHAHILIGKYSSEPRTANALLGLNTVNDDPSSVNSTSKHVLKCIKIINRRYCAYYKARYKTNKNILSRHNDKIKPVFDQTDFLNKLKYIHLNSCIPGLDNIPEETFFSSYPFYLAHFLDKDMQICSMPALQDVIKNHRNYELFTVLDYSIALSLYDNGKGLRNTMFNFIKDHHKDLLNKYKNKNRSLNFVENAKTKSGINDLLTGQSIIVESNKMHFVDQCIYDLKCLAPGMNLLDEEVKRILTELQIYFDLKTIKDLFKYLKSSHVNVYLELVNCLLNLLNVHKISTITGLNRTTLIRRKTEILI